MKSLLKVVLFCLLVAPGLSFAEASAQDSGDHPTPFPTSQEDRLAVLEAKVIQLEAALSKKLENCKLELNFAGTTWSGRCYNNTLAASSSSQLVSGNFIQTRMDCYYYKLVCQAPTPPTPPTP